MSAQLMIERLLELTHWQVSQKNELGVSIELLDCTLELASPDGQALRLRAKLVEFPDDEDERLALSKNFALHNVALCKSSSDRVVIEGNAFFLEAVIPPSDLENLDIEACVKTFLDNYDFLKATENHEKTDVPFDLTMLL